MNFKELCKEIWKENKVYVVILILIVMIVTVSIVSVINARKTLNEAQIVSAQSQTENTIAAYDGNASEAPNNQVQLGIRQMENVRTHGNIVTVQFETYNIETSEVCNISDGTISNDDIKSTLEIYLSSNKYKTISVGMVDNKFYIQQDTSIEETKEQLVNLVTLNSTFSADDWFSLTEATYNNTYIQADSLCRYTANGKDVRQYIYVYIDKESQPGTQTNISDINTENNIKEPIKTDLPVETPEETDDTKINEMSAKTNTNKT